MTHLIQHAQYGQLIPAAYALVDAHATNTKAHLLATGAAMEALAQKLGGDPETWKVAGLLHDLDWDSLNKDWEKHCGAELEAMLKSISASEDLVGDIRSHYAQRYGEQYPLDSLLRKALYCVDELTGFIIAVTYVRPSKKIRRRRGEFGQEEAEGQGLCRTGRPLADRQVRRAPGHSPRRVHRHHFASHAGYLRSVGTVTGQSATRGCRSVSTVLPEPCNSIQPR